MKHKVFSIFDEKAGAYLPPFCLPNAPVAQRAFADMIRDPNHAFGRNPGDYALMQLGVFDDGIGRFELPAGGPATVVTGRDLKSLLVRQLELPDDDLSSTKELSIAELKERFPYVER